LPLEVIVMMKYLILSCLSLALLACQPEKGKTEQKGIQEIPTDTKVRNSELIRIPVSADGVGDQSGLASIEFTETEFDFGKIKEGAVVNHSFAFKNVGDKPLMITSCRSTCGCTIPDWPREPIPPGDSGEIKVRFNTENKKGAQTKPITITANTYPADTKIFIKGFIEEGNP